MTHIERMVIRRGHPKHIIVGIVGFLWFVYFLWQKLTWHAEAAFKAQPTSILSPQARILA
jgi:hypothetical protein